MVARRDVVVAMGGFDESLTDTEDLDLVERLAEVCQFIGVEGATLLWRQHDQRGPASHAAWRNRYRQSRIVLKRSISRRSAKALPWSWRVNRHMRSRGWAVHDAFNEAQRCLHQGQRSTALRLLASAVLVSPLHTAVAARRATSLLISILRPPAAKALTATTPKLG
jgi:hypothetical protein